MIAAACALVTLLAPGEERPYLEAARGAARWLESVAIETGRGLAWPVAPGDSLERSTSLYAGAPGVVLFLVELAAADEAWRGRALELARRGGDELTATLPRSVAPDGCGLYTGVAGAGCALLELWRATGEERYREGAIGVSELLHAAAEATPSGVRWGEVTDVIAGAAGTGLHLLRAAEVLERPQDLELAARAGRELIARARPEEQGLSWELSPGFPRAMPNFSHGTAGVAYFLARLHGATGDAAFLDAAQAGAAHLLAIADRSDGGLRVHHHSPGGEELYYLGWCHGPVGTARLFEALHRELQGSARSCERVAECARAVRASGIPAQRTPGFWDNVGLCCGTAGVAQFFASVPAGGEADALAFAKRLAEDVLARATHEGDTLCWIQAEHRVRPDLLQAQTGLMQGAAGIGIALLHLDARLQGRERAVVLPDDPF